MISVFCIFCRAAFVTLGLEVVVSLNYMPGAASQFKLLVYPIFMKTKLFLVMVALFYYVLSPYLITLLLYLLVSRLLCFILIVSLFSSVSIY